MNHLCEIDIRKPALADKDLDEMYRACRKWLVLRIICLFLYLVLIGICLYYWAQEENIFSFNVMQDYAAMYKLVLTGLALLITLMWYDEKVVYVCSMDSRLDDTDCIGLAEMIAQSNNQTLRRYADEVRGMGREYRHIELEAVRQFVVDAPKLEAIEKAKIQLYGSTSRADV